MVSKNSVLKQLKQLNFNPNGWGRSEVHELHHILLPDEKIYELVNGYYEDGFALLVATDVRVLLVDKKPMNYLTVEDLRFDMINEIDYSHRLLGARISIATGSKNLKFNSYNQPRLRKLINHVQDCMAASKRKESHHQEGQAQHLERINEQLQKYLKAQHEYQEKLHAMQMEGRPQAAMPEPVKPAPELADFLYAQSLMDQFRQGGNTSPMPAPAAPLAQSPQKQAPPVMAASQDDLYAEGMKEIFGHRQSPPSAAQPVTEAPPAQHRLLDINPINIAYSKLPLAMRNRKFGRPSFHAHSASETKESRETKPAVAQGQPAA